MNNQKKYLIAPAYAAERKGNYDLRDKTSSKWQQIEIGTMNLFCGNICAQTYFDTKESKFKFGEYEYKNKNHYLVSQTIPSSLALYRLICTFFAAPIVEDNYKTVWAYPLQHKTSGEIVLFSEFKGAFNFQMKQTSIDKLPYILGSDLLELLNYLASEQCAHPYDELTAGSVA